MSVDVAVNQFNSDLLQLSKMHKNIHLIDFHDFTEQFSSDQLVNWKFYLISQTQLSTKLAKDFSEWFSNIERELDLKRKKCLVLDLDNTLWGGILGEDGVEGIKIGGDYPGNAFYYWQQALLELSKSGVILTICSKNNEQDVEELWKRNPFMVLRQENFSAWRINWNDKASNIQELAKELNIGLDSMVFLDDNPAERLLVSQSLPMVTVPEFPSRPYELMPFFKHLVTTYFRVYTITDEDRQKTAQYKANAQRVAARSQFVDMEAYLSSLDTKIDIIAANEFNISRIAQMTQKTNQFNLTTHRYTESEIKQLLVKEWKIFCISVSDRFGDNGITGAVFFKPMSDNQFEIETLLLSCRILGKGIEQAFLSYCLNLLRREGVQMIYASYLPTAKNIQVSDFYDRMGFSLTDIRNDSKYYELPLHEAFPIKPYYKIEMK
jgi:FkbH-like protein